MYVQRLLEATMTKILLQPVRRTQEEGWLKSCQQLLAAKTHLLSTTQTHLNGGEEQGNEGHQDTGVGCALGNDVEQLVEGADTNQPVLRQQ